MLESPEESPVDREAEDEISDILFCFRNQFTEYEEVDASYYLKGDPEDLESFVLAALEKVQARGLVALQKALYEWGQATFTYDRHPVEALFAHLHKEAGEIVVNPNDPYEYADFLILLLQAISYSQRFSLDEIIATAWQKLEINKQRTYTQPGPDGTIEHDRSGEPTKEAAAQRIAACVRACDGIPTRALEFGVVSQMREACTAALAHVNAYRVTERERELLRSQLELVLAKGRKE